MNYRLRRQGEDLGAFSLEELRRRRDSGELTGSEYVQGEGMLDWQPLDLVLQQGYRVVPPPLPASVSKRGPGQGVIWLIVAGGVIFFILFAAFFAYLGINFQRGYQSAIRSSRSSGSPDTPRPEAEAAASKPILLGANALTEADARKRGREFRVRQWLEGYKQRGRRNSACDATVVQYLQTWIARNYGGPDATNPVSIARLTEQLAADTHCTDPLVLAVMANNSRDASNKIHRFELALNGFSQSQHRAYPGFYADVVLAGCLNPKQQPARIGDLDHAALDGLRKCFVDGSFMPVDQPEIAEIFVNGWGDGFFERNGAAVCRIANEAGPTYQWLALMLDGEYQITEAWKARGKGYADTVTKPAWQAFHSHLAAAEKSLTAAWTLEPGFPLAPCRMMAVSLGNSGIDDMRLWFDRTLAAQLDYPEAWSELRWGLRPRWYGNQAALLDLGKTAVNTGRFDTDVPRKFFDCVADVEAELDQPAGRHIYGREDIWPEFQRLYRGYIAEPAQSSDRAGWRTAYAVVAYFAGKYDVTREQLEALDWKPVPETLRNWGADLSFMPLEVAARTGPLGEKVAAAEASYQNQNFAAARRQYIDLSTAANQDARTREFIQHRLAALSSMQLSPEGKLQLLPLPPPESSPATR